MDPNQGLCLGALFDIAATNVSTHSFGLVSSMGYPLSDFIHTKASLSRVLIWVEDSVFLVSAVPLRC